MRNTYPQSPLAHNQNTSGSNPLLAILEALVKFISWHNDTMVMTLRSTAETLLNRLKEANSKVETARDDYRYRYLEEKEIYKFIMKMDPEGAKRTKILVTVFIVAGLALIAGVFFR